MAESPATLPIPSATGPAAALEERIPSPIGAPFDRAHAAFGTDGIRGRVGTAITPALALQVGYWCGRVLPAEGPVVIGTDSRTSGPMLVAALTAGLTAAGRQVWQLGLCPTPAVPGTIRRCGAAGGLMVSASHNPPHDNGIKVFGASGAKLVAARQQAIEAGLQGRTAPPPLHGSGREVSRPDLLAAYVASLRASTGGQRLDGCGGAPEALLQGEAWTVERIGDSAVLDGAPPTLSFGTDGSVSGNASCNSFGAGYRLTGEGLTFTPIVATKRACVEANRMQQESAFLDQLGRSTRFDIRPDGALLLETATGQTLLARRP